MIFLAVKLEKYSNDLGKFQGNDPKIAKHFRFVKYCHLPRIIPLLMVKSHVFFPHLPSAGTHEVDGFSPRLGQ
jgi:hypothetical protein